MATTTDLLDLDGIGQRAESFRFDLLDKSLHRIGTVQVPRLGGTIPEIENVTTRATKRAMRGFQLPPGTADDVNPYTDRIRPVMVLENGAEIHMGVFLFLSATSYIQSQGTTLGSDLADQGLILDQPIVETLSFAPYANIADCLVRCFDIAGFTPDRYVIDQLNATLGTTGVQWRAGTRLVSCMNQLCARGGAYSVFFTASGLGRVKVVQDISQIPPTVSYAYGPNGNVIRDSIVATSQTIFAPNRYLVTDTSANAAPVTGTYVVPATAPHSFENIGYYRTQVITEQGLPDTFAAQRRAMVEYVQDAADYLWASFSGVIDPRHDTFDIIAVDGDRYRELKWGPVQLAPGAIMPHDLRLIYTDVESGTFGA